MTQFSSLGLRPEIVLSLQKLGFETPTSIQEQSIAHILNSKQDLIALAQTGTGKTGAFSLPTLSLIHPELRHPQMLILCPTRELCLQISKDTKNFLSFLPGIQVAAIYGGDSYTTQLRSLNSGAQVIVGTPGRTLDMVNRGKLNLSQISWLVLDEADEMLKMGFKEELDAILETSPKEKQTLLFSATMDRTVEQIAKTYMKNPKEISTSIKNSGSSNITHEYYMVHAKDKYEALKRILDAQPDIYGIIFCNTRLETHLISTKLTQEHYTAAPISGELSQAQREQVMAQFRNRQIRLLVATDVAARGIDVKELSHVIHYGLPTKIEYYTHRSGRTGRANSTGTSIAIIHSRENQMMRMIENKTGISFLSKKVPTANEICTAQLLSLIEKITETKTDVADMTPYLPIIEEKLSHLTREELVHHLVAVELSRFINFYKDLPDIQTQSMREPGGFRNKLRERQPYSRENMTRMRLNVGRRNKFSVPRLFEIVNAQPSINGIQLGEIALQSDHTFVEVDSNGADKFIQALKGKKINGVSLALQIVPPKRSEPGSQIERYPQKIRGNMFRKRR